MTNEMPRHPSDVARFTSAAHAEAEAGRLSDALRVDLSAGVTAHIGMRDGTPAAVIVTPDLSVVICSDLADE